MVRGDVNKMKRKKRAKALMQQIYVPKCCQQPRSAGPKPRTDFSLFFSSSSSSSTTSSSLSLECSAFCSILRRRRGSRSEFSSYKDNLSGITAAIMDKGCESFIPIQNEIPKFSLVPCSMSQNGEKGAAFSNFIGVPVTEIEVAQTKVQDTQNKRNDVGCKSGDVAKLFCLNNSTSQVTGCDHVGMAPGSTVWAKTASQMWWPAKIMEERSTPVSTYGNPVRGLILVQYYGNQECAWLDPAGDVSQFEECFEERSCNSMEAFQDALQQALNTCKQLYRDQDRLKRAGQHEQSSDAQSDKCIESSSSRTKDEFLESGRGKRKKKPKVHFDEATFPVKSARKVRRFRIMRYLGLTAPVGSPFSLSARMATANKSSSLLDT